MRIEIRRDPCATAQEAAFIAAHPQAEAFDDPRFAALVHKHYGYDVWRLSAFAGQDLVGLLVLTHVKTPLFGNALIAPAFFVSGGVLWPDDPLPLLQAAVELGRSLHVDHLELRLRTLPAGAEHIANLHVSETYAFFRGPLITDLQVLPSKTRSHVRLALADQTLTSVTGDFDSFVRCYRRSMHDLGTPMHAPGFYRELYETLPARVDTVFRAGEPLCAVMSFVNRDTVLPYYGGGFPAARAHDAFDRMYFDLMQQSAAQGYRVFDFGRSKRGTGAFEYKRRRGFAPAPAVYVQVLIGRKTPPEYNPLNPKYARAASVWRRLPLCVADRIGPPLARQLA